MSKPDIEPIRKLMRELSKKGKIELVIAQQLPIRRGGYTPPEPPSFKPVCIDYLNNLDTTKKDK